MSDAEEVTWPPNVDYQKVQNVFCGIMGHLQICFKRTKETGASTCQVESEEINHIEHQEYRDKYILKLNVNDKF